MVQAMMEYALRVGDAEARRPMIRAAQLFLLTYSFLLRLPSEALCVTGGSDDGTPSCTNARLFFEGERLVLVLRRRKNKQYGSRLVRTCWCNECQVHGRCYLVALHLFHVSPPECDHSGHMSGVPVAPASRGAR